MRGILQMCSKKVNCPKKVLCRFCIKPRSTGGRPVAIYNLDVVISVGYRVKSFQGTRFRQWATGILREMLLNRLDEVREISKLKRRVDFVEGDINLIKGGVSYLVKQLTEPNEPPRRRIGFNTDGEPPIKP